MKILVLGGTVFLGRHIVEAALARGHTLTLFNRGQHNPDLFPGVARLTGNRDGALEALKGQQWDAVIDTCGYVPRVVRQSAELLSGAVQQYVFISSISVFADFKEPRMDETAPVAKLADQTTEQVTGDSYGPLKALCEQVVEETMPGRALLIRPGLIAGPHDPTDRFTYWVHRIAQGGEVLAPGNPEREIQFIDVRDLAEWTIRMVELARNGVFNATGPDRGLTMREVLESSLRVSGSDAHPIWVEEQFLIDHGVAPWMQMPLWVPEKDGDRGLFSLDCRKAISAGLAFRSIDDTVRDTLAWDSARPSGELRAGLKPDQEADLLREWHSASLR